MQKVTDEKQAQTQSNFNFNSHLHDGTNPPLSAERMQSKGNLHVRNTYMLIYQLYSIENHIKYCETERILQHRYV